jgi:polyisoprenoid-binding protein YceI
MRTTVLVMLSTLMLATGCKDPTQDKPKAEVSPAQPAPVAPPAAATPGAESLAIDTANSKVGWVGSKVTGSHTGDFKQFKGTIDLPGGKPEAGKVNVEIDTASITSDNDKLTTHLKSADFFDVAQYPKATFTSTEIKPGGTGGATHTVTGVLTLHGVPKTITFPATVDVSDSEVGVKAEFSINRQDFKIAYAGKPDDLIRDDVLIKLDVKAPRNKK